MVKKYELPDEMMQLIAAAPNLTNDRRYLQQRQNFDTRTPGSELIAALRSFGTDNTGITRYANAGAADAANPLGGRRGIFNPPRLGMKRIPRDVSLPGAETQTLKVVNPVVLNTLLTGGDSGGTGTIITGGGGTGTTTTGTGTTTTGTTTTLGTTSTDDGDTNTTATAGTGTGGTGTGTGTGGSGTAGTGGTSSGGMGGTGTTGTGVTTAGTGSTGGTTDVRSAIEAAMGGSGSIDNSAAGVDAGASSLNSASSLSADQITALTKPKVASVTLDSSGLALDDSGSTSMTFDYPEFLSPEELKAYEAWMATQGGGAAGAAGKPGFDETLGALEF